MFCLGRSTVRKFADDLKLSSAVDTTEGQDATQRDLGKLEKSVYKNLIKFNKSKCNVLHLGQGTPRQGYRLREEVIGSSPVEMGLGVLVDEKLDMDQLVCVLAAQKANCILGWIKSSVASKSREGILHSGETPPGVLHPVLGSSAQNGQGSIGASPEEGMKKIRGMEHTSFEDGLRELGLFRMEERIKTSLQPSQYLKRAYKRDGD